MSLIPASGTRVGKSRLTYLAKIPALSVRGKIVLVLAIGGWLVWVVYGARIRREAVAAITRVGGSVQYDWEWRNGNAVRGEKTWAPRWLENRIGVDYFGHVTDVRFPHRITDVEIAPVDLLTQLQRLSLDQAWVTDDGLFHLKGLTKRARPPQGLVNCGPGNKDMKAPEGGRG